MRPLPRTGRQIGVGVNVALRLLDLGGPDDVATGVGPRNGDTETDEHGVILVLGRQQGGKLTY